MPPAVENLTASSVERDAFPSHSDPYLGHLSGAQQQAAETCHGCSRPTRFHYIVPQIELGVLISKEGEKKWLIGAWRASLIGKVCAVTSTRPTFGPPAPVQKARPDGTCL